MHDNSATETALGRWHASHSLVKRAKRERDVATLIRMLDEPAGLRDEKGRELPNVRMTALRALRKVGDGRAVEPLVDLLSDSRTQLPAAIALGQIGDVRAIPALLDVLGDQDEFAARIVQDFPGWLRLIRHPIGTFEAMGEDHEMNLRGKALSSLASLRAREVLPLIVRLLAHEDPWIRAWAAELAERIGDPVAIPPVRAAERRTPLHQRRRIRKARRQLERGRPSSPG